MFLTRECDYGVRTIRALACGEKKTVKTICEMEEIPDQYAYKILKKLEHAKLVQGIRGRDGGYQLVKPLNQITLLDIVSAIDDGLLLNACLKEGHVCTRNPEDKPCSVHIELERVQDVLVAEIKSTTMQKLIEG